MLTLHRNQSLIEAEIDGDTVMMNPDTGDYYGLGSVASRIWQLLEEPSNEDAIVTQLLEEYDVTEAQCREEVRAFLKQLLDNNIVIAGE